LQPTNSNKRIDTLDYLRGFALLGIILVNIPSLMWIEPPELANDIAYSRLLTLFVEGKFFYHFFIFIWNRILSLYFTRTGKGRKSLCLI